MNSSPLFAFAAALAATPLFTDAALSQDARPPEVKISKVDVQLVPSPEFSSNINLRAPRDAAKWLQVEVEFDLRIPGATLSAPAFLDELTVSYFVAFMPDSLDGGAQHPLAGKALTLDVTHVDVKSSTPGQSRYSVAYLPARVLERMVAGQNVLPSNINVAVEIKYKGTTLASRAEGPLKNTEGWWSQVPSASGILVSKDQTPFAPLVWDRYEPMKPAGR